MRRERGQRSAGQPAHPEPAPRSQLRGRRAGHRLERLVAARWARPTPSTSPARRSRGSPCRATPASSRRAMRAGTARSATPPSSNTTGPTSTATRRSSCPRCASTRASSARPTSTPPTPAPSAASVNVIDPNLKNDKEYEVVAGLDHELLPNFAVGAAYTYRRGVDTLHARRHRQPLAAPHRRDARPTTAWALRSPATATRSRRTSSMPACQHARGRHRRPHLDQPSRLLPPVPRHRADRDQAHVRQVDVARVASRNGLDGPASRDRAALYNNPNPIDLDPQIDGGQVIRQGAGSGKALYVGAKWQAVRQRPLPAARRVRDRGQLLRPPGLSEADLHPGQHRRLRGHDATCSPRTSDAERLPNLYNLDLRLAKNLKFGRTQPHPQRRGLQRVQHRHRAQPQHQRQLGAPTTVSRRSRRRASSASALVSTSRRSVFPFSPRGLPGPGAFSFPEQADRRARRRRSAAARCEGGIRGRSRTPTAMVCECSPLTK